jgi:nitroreductase
MSTTTHTEEFISVLKSLRAVRQFADRPLAPGAVRDIHEVIRWSGNASNRQAFQVLWIENRAMLRQLSELPGYAHHLAGAAAGAAIVSLLDSDELNAFDEGRISERIMLAAHAHGIGSSVGWLRGDGRKGAARLLGLPADHAVRTTVSLGYPAEGALRGGRRKPMDEFVQRLA